MKYLKRFETREDYNDYITSNNFISPNSSRIENNDNILMRFDNNAAMLTVTFNIPYDNYTCNIVSNYYNTIKKVIIDDEIIYDDFTNFAGTKSYTFKTAGIHTIKISFNNKYVIGNNAPIFNGVSNLKDIKIPNIFTEISSNAFIDCSLIEINIPNSITNIGSYVFGGCPLKKITFGKGLTSLNSLSYYAVSNYYIEECNILSEITTLPSNMFYGYSHLLKVTIPNSVTSIGENAFSGCTNLTSINIPDFVTFIGHGAFNYCSNLTSINIPDSVTSIGGYTFNNCSNLEEVNISNNSSLTNIGNGAFNGCSNLTAIIIPDSVTSIGSYAFYNTKLSNINISNNLTSIGSYAFNVNYNIQTNVYFDNSTINNLGNIINPSIIKNLEIGQHAITQNGELCLTTFGGFNNLKTIIFPEGLTVLPSLYGFSSLKTFNVPTTITTIADNCFWGCNSLEDSYVKNGIRYIDIDGFGTYIISIADYTLQNYTIKNGVKSLPFTFNSSFTNIQSITLPEGLIELPNISYIKSSLTNINIPSTITSINDNYFYGCNLLEDSYVEDGIRYIDIDGFGTYFISIADYTLQHYTIKNGSTSIPFTFDSSFTNIESITLPNSLTTIADGEFDYLYENNILTSQQIDFILNINPNAITNYEIKELIKQPKSYFEDKYFSICALESGTFNYSFFDAATDENSSNYKVLEYSKDNGETWLSIDNATGTTSTSSSPTKTISVLKNDIILFRSTIIPQTTEYLGRAHGVGNIRADFTYYVTGNIMSLLYGDNFIGKTSLSGKNYAFEDIFNPWLLSYNDNSYKKLIRADKLILPATVLSTQCYKNMFSGCSNLITIPELSSVTTLASYCYSGMFADTKITTAPELPLTTLATGCYYEMFRSCKSLTTAPSLPATTLTKECYVYMFSSCTALTTTPQLPATTLAESCYASMFSGCKSLTAVPELPVTTLTKQCYVAMFKDCTGLTTVSNNLLPATTLAESCYSSMFESCTSLITPPKLPATILGRSCYERMFYGCTSLTTAPELPATTLAKYCYYCMFYNCININKITMLATNISASYCLNAWLTGVSSTGTFIKAASMTSLPSNGSGIPSGWVVQDYVEPHIPRELPEGYTEEKYIASTNTGGQYIDLNILLYDVLNKNYDIAIKYNVLGAGKDNNQPTLFGCQNQTSPWPGTFIRMNQNRSTNTVGRFIGGTNKDNTLGNNNTIIELPVQTSPNKNVYNYNNSGQTHSFGTSLFCAFSDVNNTPFKFIEAKIYYFKLFVEGTLVRDLVPCINSSNVPGLYDVVNDVFYTSLSSSPFIYESY